MVCDVLLLQGCALFFAVVAQNPVLTDKGLEDIHRRPGSRGRALLGPGATPCAGRENHRQGDGPLPPKPRRPSSIALCLSHAPSSPPSQDTRIRAPPGGVLANPRSPIGFRGRS